MINNKVEDILLSKKITKVIREDFYIFEADSFLPIDFYRALNKSFPEKSLLEAMALSTSKNNQYYNRLVLKFNASNLNKESDDFFIKNQEWGLFISLLTDKRFIYDALDLFGKPISDHKGIKYYLRKNVYSKYVKKNPTIVNKLVNKLVNKVDINFTFSVSGPSEGLFTHTDSNNKLITLLLYFPEKDWKTEYHGETSFFKLKNNVSRNKKNKWGLLGKRNFHISDPKLVSEFRESHDLLYKSKYKPNILAGFVKNDISWHAIDPITCPKNKLRRVFIINIKK